MKWWQWNAEDPPEDLPPLVDEPNQREIDAQSTELLRKALEERKAEKEAKK